MPVHLIGSGARGVFDIESTCTFTSILRVSGAATSPQPTTLSQTMVACPRAGWVAGDECRACAQLQAWRVQPSVNVYCTVDDHDIVEHWMRRKPPATTVEARCRAADDYAASRGVHHLLVFDRKLSLAGMACRCDLARGGDAAVADVMSSDVFAVEPTTTLGVAATAMKELRIRCLAVVSGPLVLGIVTRRDLDRAGVPATWESSAR